MADEPLPRRAGQGKLIDITGQRFGRLIVLHRDLSRGVKPTRWACLCDCGKTKTGILSASLTGGRTRSCGCIHTELAAKRNRTHGLSRTPTYVSWASMWNRCTNPNGDDYEAYGGRGITVCDRWRKFENFLEDMGTRPDGKTIDRRDNSAGYCKENCHWVTQERQTRNTRRTLYLTHNGRTQPLVDWCDELGIAHSCAKERMKKGFSAEKILSTQHFKPGPRQSKFAGIPRPDIPRDPVTKRFISITK